MAKEFPFLPDFRTINKYFKSIQQFNGHFMSFLSFPMASPQVFAEWILTLHSKILQSHGSHYIITYIITYFLC